jgi:protein ImuA
MSESFPALARLRRSLERIEPRREATRAGLFACGDARIDAVLGGGLARGRLHELFADEADAGSGAGFAALLSLRAGEGRRPILWLRTEAAEKRAGRLHATGLGELGLDPASLLLALLPDEAALLRTAVDAARCTGLGALLIECWGSARSLDLTSTRRLMLAVEGSGVTLLLLRIAAEPSPSAADTRWHISAAPSIALEADAPGAPMFDLELLRRRAGAPAGPWRVEWDRDRLCFRDPSGNAASPGSPLPRLVLPLAAGRAAAADPAAPLRHTG